MASIFEDITSGARDRFGKNLYNPVAERRFENLRLVETNPYREDPLINFSKSESSFSGTDCTVFVQINSKLFALGNLETFSYSIFREKHPVRVLGRSHPKGFTSGGRSISGSLIFITFDRAPLYDIIREINYVRNPSDRTTSPLADQLPPLDFILLLHNEYGSQSILRLYGVEFITEGQVHSINDLYTENTTQYVARDIDSMIPYEHMQDFRNMMFERQARGLFVDNYLNSMLEYKKKLEQQLIDTNNIIEQIDVESGRRAIDGILTLGAAHVLNKVFTSVFEGKKAVTRADLNKEKAKQLKIKDFLLKELEKINSQIQKYEQNIKGYNAQNNNGFVGIQNLKHAPVR